MPPSHNRLARGSRGRRACSRKRWPSCATTGSSSATPSSPRRNDRGRGCRCGPVDNRRRGRDARNPMRRRRPPRVSPSASRAAMADASVQPVPCASMAGADGESRPHPVRRRRHRPRRHRRRWPPLSRTACAPRSRKAALARCIAATSPMDSPSSNSASGRLGVTMAAKGSSCVRRHRARRPPAASHRRSPPSLDRERPVHRRALRAFRQRLRSRQLLRASRALRRGCRSRRSTLRPAPAGTPCPARAPR